MRIFFSSSELNNSRTASSEVTFITNKPTICSLGFEVGDVASAAPLDGVPLVADGVLVLHNVLDLVQIAIIQRLYILLILFCGSW